MTLWWIPRDRLASLSATDLAVIRMCRVVTIFLVTVTVYMTMMIVRGPRECIRPAAIEHPVERAQ